MQQVKQEELDVRLVDDREEALCAQELIDYFDFFARDPLMRFYKYVGIKGAEWNFMLGIPINLVLQADKASLSAASLGINVGWNYLDGVYSIGLGISQIFEEEDYHQTQNKIKAAVNIISGLQLFIFSYNPLLTAAVGLAGGAALAPAAFAISMLAEVVTAAIDFGNAHKEYEFEGWLDERAKEMAYKKQRIAEFELKLKSPSELAKNEDKYIAAKIKMLAGDIDGIQNDICARSRVYYAEIKSDKFISILETHVEVTNSLRGQLTAAVTSADCEKNQKIQDQLTKNLEDKAGNLALKTAGFVAMALIALSPFLWAPLLGVGLFFAAVVAVCYVVKHKIEIEEKLTQYGFFKNSETETHASNDNTLFTSGIFSQHLDWDLRFAR